MLQRLARLVSRRAAAPPKPQIELEFLAVNSSSQPKLGADGSYAVDRAMSVSGNKVIRDIMFENKLEMYAAYGKLMNCSGTCIAEIVDGKELLNERKATANRYLKKNMEPKRVPLGRLDENAC